MGRRTAFTLIEMMVSMALIIFVMLLLTQAFTAGVAVFGELKAIGDLDARLRAATTLLRRDLTADHFEGGRKISDPNFFSQGPPQKGFLRIWQGSARTPTGPRNFIEGTDGDNIPSARATDHILDLTVLLHGNNQSDYFATQVDPTATWPLYGQPITRYQSLGTYTCQWIQASYFLQPTGDDANGTPLYALCRRHFLLLPQNDDANYTNPTPSGVLMSSGTRPYYSEVSCKQNPSNPSTVYFNNPTDITVPQRRFGMDPTQDGGIPIGPNGSYPNLAQDGYPTLAGADILLTDVISFDLKVFSPIINGTDFADLVPSTPPYAPLGNPLFQNANGPFVYDTWSSVSDGTYDYSAWNDQNPASPPNIQVKRVPLPIQIKAIKVTIRVWDRKSQKTRQMTLVQEM